MAEKRKDNKGRNLRIGESQRPDGRYRYRWQENGKQQEVCALTLAEFKRKRKADTKKFRGWCRQQKSRYYHTK